jgi:hypothetical protein
MGVIKNFGISSGAKATFSREIVAILIKRNLKSDFNNSVVDKAVVSLLSLVTV